jgi:hypothetical protein
LCTILTVGNEKRTTDLYNTATTAIDKRWNCNVVRSDPKVDENELIRNSEQIGDYMSEVTWKPKQCKDNQQLSVTKYGPG